jgi:hypothetical protein
MNQVKIYNTICYKAYMMDEQGERLTLEPWSGNTVDYEGESDEGTFYELPEGCVVARTVSGELEIFNGIKHCPFFSENGKPKIILRNEIITLRKVGI